MRPPGPIEGGSIVTAAFVMAIWCAIPGVFASISIVVGWQGKRIALVRMLERAWLSVVLAFAWLCTPIR